MVTSTPASASGSAAKRLSVCITGLIVTLSWCWCRFLCGWWRVLMDSSHVSALATSAWETTSPLAASGHFSTAIIHYCLPIRSQFIHFILCKVTGSITDVDAVDD